MKITVFGSGYVGLVQAAVLAEVGHDVVCMDIDQKKVELLRQGHVSIFEPGLSSLVREGLEALLILIAMIAYGALVANVCFKSWPRRIGIIAVAVIVPVLAMAGSLAAKQRATATDGTLPTHGPLFVALLAGVVLLVGLLNYVPALALGPVVEHLMLWPR